MARTDGLYQRRGYHYFKYKSDGIWREHATGTRNYGEARQVKRDFLKDLEDGKLPNNRSRWNLQQAIDYRLTDRKHRITAGSYASEVTITRTLVRILGAETRLDRIATIHQVKRLERTRLEERISPKTINNEVGVLAGILRDANLWRRIEPDYKRLPVRKSDIPDALTRDEALRLVQVARTAPEDSVAPFVAILAYSTGMRAGEIRQLQLGSIHLGGELPELQVMRATTKTNTGARFVALDSMACWALQKLLDRAARLGATQPGHYLLPTLLDRHTRTNDPLHGGSGWDPEHPMGSWDVEWDRVRQAAKIEHRRMHDMRHSWITRAAEAGVPVMVVQTQVGHLSKQMVEHYTHISHAAVHKAAKQVEAHSTDLLRQLGVITSEVELTSDDSSEPPPRTRTFSRRLPRNTEALIGANKGGELRQLGATK